MQEYQETHLSNETYCRHHKVLISAKNNDRLPNYYFLFFKKKALQDLPLDRSATYLSLVVQDF